MPDRDLRITGPVLKVLTQFLNAPVEQQSGAALSKSTKVGAGTLYPLLARFEAAGWVTSEWEAIDPKVEGRPRRRFYRLTGLGCTRARAAANEYGIKVRHQEQTHDGVPSWVS